MIHRPQEPPPAFLLPPVVLLLLLEHLELLLMGLLSPSVLMQQEPDPGPHLSDDVFEDWRAWIVTLGRDTFQRVAADPDALADVDDLAGSCGGAGERFAYAVSTVYFERHGDEDENFPIANLEEPRGERLTDPADVRAALPRLAARIPRDGLGQGPGSYVDP